MEVKLNTQVGGDQKESKRQSEANNQEMTVKLLLKTDMMMSTQSC